jgi:hypothetical protein
MSAEANESSLAEALMEPQLPLTPLMRRSRSARVGYHPFAG